MTDKTIYKEASKVEADQGVVTVKGPDDVDVKLTEEAAAETSDRLFAESTKARAQKYRQEKKKAERPC
ncbi:MAG TPA: hypothetical protein VJM09_09640 [Sphingobium sp.]|nr:hypothetical protein [Sphingobium sp.]